MILLDEIEKAHPDVFNVLLQVLDDGRLTDGQGRTVDFKNTVVIMTSNIGSQIIAASAPAGRRRGLRGDEAPGHRRAAGQFRPEFLNRIDEVIVFHALTDADLAAIVDLLLADLQRRLAAQDLALEAHAAAPRRSSSARAPTRRSARGRSSGRSSGSSRTRSRGRSSRARSSRADDHGRRRPRSGRRSCSRPAKAVVVARPASGAMPGGRRPASESRRGAGAAAARGGLTARRPPASPETEEPAAGDGGGAPGNAACAVMRSTTAARV